MEKIKKIDFHVHAQLPGGPDRLVGGTYPTPDELRVTYDKFNIEKGVELCVITSESSYDFVTSRNTEELARSYPDTIGWWFCYINAELAKNPDSDDLAYYIDFYRDRGAVGVGEIHTNMFIDDPRMLCLLSACEKRDVPIIVHFENTGAQIGVLDDVGLPKLDRVLDEFPRLKLFGHAPGFWSAIIGESYEDTPLVKLMRKHPNLQCDISAGSGLRAITADEEKGIRFLEEFNERIYYGTDLCGPAEHNRSLPATAEFLDRIAESGELSYDAYLNICRRNALAMLQK